MKSLAFISLILSVAVHAVAQQRVGVGTLNPDLSAKLELNAQDKGVLIPRMTSAQREMIPNPTNGLLVFDVSTIGFWYFDGVQWVQPFGPTGPQGPTGPTGIQGPLGAQGATGQPSNIIGSQGVVGVTGAQGLQGPSGPIGLQGAQGILGVTGVTGPQGLDGPTGAQGIPGILGPTGPLGNTGPQGVVGVTGIDGPVGPQGISGPTGPMGPPSFNTAIAINANGLMSVTDPQSNLNAQQAAWMLAGNGGTNPANNFLGTTDAQDLNLATNSAEKMRVLSNGDVWVDGSKPFLLRRFYCNGCDNPNRNTGVSVNDYVAWVAGFYPTGDQGDTESTRSRMYASGGTWWFKGDLQSVNDEDWSVDVLFVKLEMADDQRPGSSNGGGTGF